MDNFENFSSNEKNAENNSTPPQSGYTVTPEGGFYSKHRDDIIQDTLNNQQKSANATNESKERFDGGYGFNPPAQASAQKQKRRFSLATVILAVVLSAIIGAVSSVATVQYVLPLFTNDTENIDKNETNLDNRDTGNPGTNVNINVEKTAENIVEAVSEKVAPSVVGIRTTTAVTNFFGGLSEASGEGSGVIYSSDGYIITNYHVIGEAALNQSGSKIEVFLGDLNSKAYSATVVGYNIAADIAVVKIEAKGLTAVEIADSDKLKVGQNVITVGNPGGLEFMDSVTYGVISGLNRVVSADSGVKLIQTDAAINPGNSGGALVNTKGELVGINSSKIVSEEFEGMGFAIPSNTTVELVKKIIENEGSPEPYVGISISETYTPSVLKYYGYPVGAVVLSVAEGSPAANAGIRRGDIVTEYGGKEITQFEVFEKLVEKSTPGQKVDITIYRSGRYYTTTITVGANNQID